MNDKTFNAIKVDLLRRKINEYFSKKPKAKSVIIKQCFENKNTYWRVVKESPIRYKVSEINTRLNTFIVEGPDDVGTVISPPPPLPKEKTGTVAAGKGQFTGPSKDAIAAAQGKKPNPLMKAAGAVKDKFKQAFAKPQPIFPGDKVPPAEPRTISRKQSFNQAADFSKWKPDNPTGEFAKTLSRTKHLGTTLTTAYDDMRKQFGGDQQAVNVMNGYLNPIGQKIATKADLNNPGLQQKLGTWLSSQFPGLKPKGAPGVSTESVVQEVDKEKKKKKENEPKKKEKTKEPEAEEELPQPEVEDEQDDDDAEGLDGEEQVSDEEPVVEPDSQDLEPKDMAPQKSDEEKVLDKNLAGQTIQNASIELSEDGGVINLTLAGMKIPAQIKWTSSGKVVFYFKNRPYVLRHG
jgi:hypothetical protein